jgi:hypothetical protein
MMTRKETREAAKAYIGLCVDDALSERSIDDMPANARMVGWQCGFEPFFVAVWSHLPGTRVDDDDAVTLATDILTERAWFADEGPRDPDYLI